MTELQRRVDEYLEANMLRGKGLAELEALYRDFDSKEVFDAVTAAYRNIHSQGTGGSLGRRAES